MDSFIISAGGGASTGGVYSMNATIGQPAAGPSMSGGQYALEAGFWSVVTTPPTSSPPLLSIQFTPTNAVIISWPSSSSDFSLQQKSNLNTLNWVPPSEAITDDGTNKFLIIQPPTGYRFYRLFKP